MFRGVNTTARISNVDFQMMGQAYQTQRHPVLFTESEHLLSSYVEHSTIRKGYNRAIGIHATHCLRVEGNVAYDVMGHNFFIEDGIEVLNKFYKNLAVSTQPSYSLLNTDQSPASFWITNPYNYLEGNRAAGSKYYGFWYDLQKTPIGVSTTSDICPSGMQLGSFKDNVAHSNGLYGIRIFPEHIPRTYPCGEIY